jgi:dihydrofolate reductase
MKVILYIASTLNGLAAKSDGDSDWVSAENTTDFNSFCRQIGCVIMGRHTFDIFNEMEFKDWPAATGLHMLMALSGTTHRILTGYALIDTASSKNFSDVLNI